MEDLRKLITPRTKAFILNTPSIPTAAMVARSSSSSLRTSAVKHDFIIVADEIYEKLVHSGE